MFNSETKINFGNQEFMGEKRGGIFIANMGSEFSSWAFLGKGSPSHLCVRYNENAEMWFEKHINFNQFLYRF